MLSSACSLWDISFPLCTYSSIFIIFLIAWQLRRTYQGLRLEPKKSCCRRHRKVRQRARDAASRARRPSQEKAEKPWKLLSIMKSQSWLPTEGNVRQLLCVDPCCQICDSATLEIQQLLESDKSQLSPALLGLPQSSSCLDLLPISSVPFEQNMELYSRHSRHLSLASGTPTLAQLTEHLTQSTNAVSVQQYWADHLQLDQKFHLADMPMISETMVSSRLEDPVVLMVEEKIMQNEPKLGQESQDQHHLESPVSLLSLNPKITNLTQSMSLHMDSVLSSHVPLLSPEVRRLLELHVKKWIHFQKWGLPKRVEESLRQLMPDPTLFCQSRKTLLSSFLSSDSGVSMNKAGAISHQSCWISEWSVINPKQRKHWHQMLDYLPSHEEHLSGCSPPSKTQAKDSGGHLQSEYYSQLFCGLPSLHSESLGVTSLSTHGVSQNKNVPKPKPSSTGRQHTKELSHPFLSKTPCKSAPPCSPASPDAKTPHEHEGARITVPFLTPAECETLECHLIERQVKLQWGLPGVFLRNQYSHMLCEPHEKAQILKTCWPRKPFPHPIRKACFPEHMRRLLEFHFQKQLIHLRWGLPQRIQRSIHLLLSSTDQQTLSCSSNRALPGVSIPQPETHGSGDRSTPTVDKGPIPMPHLFVQAKAMLKSHVDSKCDQIHQGKVPAQVWSSWECRISGSLVARSPFSWIQKGQHLKLQAESKSNKIVPWKPVTLNQEKQDLSGALIEHCKRPQALSEETIKKLETTLQHKYLAFLSGLPALYCVALSRPTSPAVTSQPKTTERMPMPVKIPPEAVTQVTLLEGPHEPCTQEDNKASANVTAESRSEVQMEKMTASQTHDIHLLNTHILAKLNFHLKRKVLAMQFGISEKEREYKELAIVSLESESIQEFLKSLSIPESTALQTLPNSGDLPPAPDASTAHLKKQPATAVQAVCHKQERPSSKAVPQDSAQEVSKTSPLRNTTDTQVPNLEEALSTEPQSPGKSETEKSQEPGKPKAAGDPGEGDTGLGLPLISQRTHREGDQEPQKEPVHGTPQGSSQHSHSCHLDDPCPPSPQEPPDPEFPDPPPEVLMEREPEHGMQHSQTKAYVIPGPARIAEVRRSVASQASQGLPFPRPPMQGKPFWVQTRQDHISRGWVMPTSPYTSPSLPEAGLKNKVKSFLHSINPKIKGKTHVEPMASTPATVTKTSKEHVDKGLPQARSPTKKTKVENFRGPKAQSVPSEKSVIASFLTAPYILDSKLRPHSLQLGSVSVSGQPRHCPRHCPRLAYATQHRNPP